MSLESARAFRQAVAQPGELQDRIREMASKPNQWFLLDLAKEYGYDFTSDEGDTVFREEIVDGELTDFELELVSAGTCVSDCVSGPSKPNCGGVDCIS